MKSEHGDESMLVLEVGVGQGQGAEGNITQSIKGGGFLKTQQLLFIGPSSTFYGNRFNAISIILFIFKKALFLVIYIRIVLSYKQKKETE